MTPREILDAVLAEHGASWSDADLKLVERVVAASADMAVAALLYGHSPDAELAQYKAQLANVSAAAAQNAANIAQATITRILSAAADIAIKGLGLVA